MEQVPYDQVAAALKEGPYEARTGRLIAVQSAAAKGR